MKEIPPLVAIKLFSPCNVAPCPLPNSELKTISIALVEELEEYNLNSAESSCMPVTPPLFPPISAMPSSKILPEPLSKITSWWVTKAYVLYVFEKIEISPPLVLASKFSK